MACRSHSFFERAFIFHLFWCTGKPTSTQNKPPARNAIILFISHCLWLLLIWLVSIINYISKYIPNEVKTCRSVPTIVNSSKTNSLEYKQYLFQITCKINRNIVQCCKWLIKINCDLINSKCCNPCKKQSLATSDLASKINKEVFYTHTSDNR